LGALGALVEGVLHIDSAPPALPEELASMVADGTAIFLTFLRLKGRLEGAGPVPAAPVATAPAAIIYAISLRLLRRASDQPHRPGHIGNLTDGDAKRRGGT